MSRARDLIELDLPFHVNGTLDAEARAELDAWLETDELLHAEAASLAIIRDEMQAEEVRSPGEFGLARLMRDVGREGAGGGAVQAPSRTWIWQAAAAVAVIGFLAQAVLMRDQAAPQGYELASAGVPGALVVAFAPLATEEAIRSLLVGQGLEIVAGPSALGLYRLDVIEGGDLEAASAALRAAADIVESVENAEN